MPDANAGPSVGFYHLTRDPVEVGVPKLLSRVYGQGLRTLVRLASPALMDQLDGALWTYEKDSFLPHGTDRNGQPDLQPILLTTGEAALNMATVLLLLENILPDDFNGFDRVLYMFDGRDSASVAQARTHWTALKARGHPLVYWQQSDAGAWTRSAEA